MIELYCGDCLEVMASMPSQSVQAIITDLPYGTTQNKWDVVIPFSPLWEQVRRILMSNGVFITTASQPFSSAIVMSNPKMFRHEWIWIKNRGGNFANTKREPFKEHEQILVFSLGKWTYNPQMQERTGGGNDRVDYVFNHRTQSTNYNEMPGRNNSSLPKLRVPSSWQKFNTEVGLHPNQKPLSLFEYIVKTYTNEGDTVLDPCMGSGTTGVACVNLGRNFIGIESDTAYYQRAANRIEENGPNWGVLRAS